MAKREFKRRRVADLVWLAAGFLALQLCLGQGIERWLPRVRDPHYVVREAKLRDLIAARPNNPLVVMIGSSRTQLGLQAKRVSGKPELANAEVFNFGIPASGPIAELVTLRRLLDHGIRPDLLLVELSPSFLSKRGNKPMEEEMLDGARLEAAELHEIADYYLKPRRLWSGWLVAQCLASSRHRAELRPQLGLDALKPWVPGTDPFLLMDDHGWLPMMISATPEQREKLTRLAYQQYHRALEEFELSVGAVQALREILALCRHGIPVALVAMPEGSVYRGWYQPEARDKIEAFLAGFPRQENVPLIDARLWVEDDGFYDGHHLLPGGAATFTDRLGNAIGNLNLAFRSRREQSGPETKSAQTFLPNK